MKTVCISRELSSGAQTDRGAVDSGLQTPPPALPQLPNPNHSPWSSPDSPHLLQSPSPPPHLGLALTSSKPWSSECSGLLKSPWQSSAAPLRRFKTGFSPGLAAKPLRTARGAGRAGPLWHRLVLQAASQHLLSPCWNKLTEDNLELPLAGDAGRKTIPSSEPLLHLSPTPISPSNPSSKALPHQEAAHGQGRDLQARGLPGFFLQLNFQGLSWLPVWICQLPSPRCGRRGGEAVPSTGAPAD